MLPVLCAKYSIFFYTLSTGVIRAALFESLILHHKKNKPEDYCNIPPASTVDIPSRWDPQGRAVQVLLSAQKKKRHTNACSLVDIPTGWEPRTKQQPTGLIAYPAAQGRAVQLLLSAQKKKRHTNACSPVDIPTGWEPRTKQQPTGLIASPAAQGRAVQVLLSAQKKKRHTNVCLFLVQ